LPDLVAALLLALNVYSLGWLLYPAFTPTQMVKSIFACVYY